MIPWQEFDAAILECGVSLSKGADGQWQDQSERTFSTPDDVAALLGLRPVVAQLDQWPEPVRLLLPATAGRLLEIYPSELMSGISRSLSFTMSAALYHCGSLARLYAAECSRAYLWASEAFEGEDRIVLRASDHYFEFEALVTTVIRGYEMLRYDLWRRWGNGGSCPRSFEGVVDAMPGCPAETVSSLRISRDATYSGAKRYRDCIHHNTDIGSASWAMLQLLDGRVWSLIVRVPDNPESKSASMFTFGQDIDALSLGWQYCTELFALVDQALNEGRLSSSGKGNG